MISSSSYLRLFDAGDVLEGDALGGSRCQQARLRLLPKLMALPPPACIWRTKNTHRPMITRKGTHQISICCQTEDSRFGWTLIWTPFSRSSGTRVSWTGGM